VAWAWARCGSSVEGATAHRLEQTCRCRLGEPDGVRTPWGGESNVRFRRAGGGGGRAVEVERRRSSGGGRAGNAGDTASGHEGKGAPVRVAARASVHRAAMCWPGGERRMERPGGARQRVEVSATCRCARRSPRNWRVWTEQGWRTARRFHASRFECSESRRSKFSLARASTPSSA